MAKIEIDESYTIAIFAIGKTSADESNSRVFSSYADPLSMWKEQKLWNTPLYLAEWEFDPACLCLEEIEYTTLELVLDRLNERF